MIPPYQTTIRIFLPLLILCAGAAIGNQAPNVSAGPSQNAALFASFVSVDLSGQVNDDGLPAGMPVTYQWQGFGPAAVSFTDDGSLQTQAQFTQPGRYFLTLTADDTQLQSQDELWVYVRTAGDMGVIVQYDMDDSLLDTAPSGESYDDLTAFSETLPDDAVFELGTVNNAARLGDSTAGMPDLLISAGGGDLLLPSIYTIEAYISPDEDTLQSQSRHRILGNLANILTLENSGLVYRHSQLLGDTVVVSGPALPECARWHHVAVVADGRNLSLWINAQLAAQVPYDGTITNISGLTDFDFLPFTGLVDGLRIHNIAVSQGYLEDRAYLLPSPADIHFDHAVNAADLLPIAQAWLSTDSIPPFDIADLNCDGHITLADFAILARDWTFNP